MGLTQAALSGATQFSLLAVYRAFPAYLTEVGQRVSPSSRPPFVLSQAAAKLGRHPRLLRSRAGSDILPRRAADEQSGETRPVLTPQRPSDALPRALRGTCVPTTSRKTTFSLLRSVNRPGIVRADAAPGLTYGGTRALDTLWLRLHPSRADIAALELPWEIAPGRCTNDPNGHFSVLFAGSFHQHPIQVTPAGKFKKTVVDRFRDRGIRFEERQTVTGTITDERVSGTLWARTIAVRPNGSVARCTSRTQTWGAVN